MQLVAPTPTPPPQQTEPWVDAVAVGKHLDFGKAVVISMAKAGEIPSLPYKRGKKTYLRFKLSQVDAAMMKLQQGSGQ